MDGSGSNSSSEVSTSKQKASRLSFVENAPVRESKPQTNSTPSTSWYEGHKEHSRTKLKDRSRESESWPRERPISRPLEPLEEDSNLTERYKEEPPPTAYPAPYSYATPTDVTYMDSNRRALGMMSNISSTYGLIAAMNSQWTMNQEGMNAGMNVSAPAAMSMNPNVDMSANSGAGMNPFTFMDPNLFGMMGMGNYAPFNMMVSDSNMVMGPPKEVLNLSKCVLYPPNPNAPPPTTRERPLGCKTVFVGGLPENASEDIIKEVFERCGEIITVRMSKKNFCHIRFSSELFVENSIYFSGYRIKVDNKDDAPNTGRLHVDYAQARDDQYEYECRQRALQREARHREQLDQEYYPPTPPPVVHYSDHEATIIGEKLRGEETFQQALFVLVTWLERGECIKRNAGSFYSMIQSTNSHVRRLMNEKLKYEDDLNKAKTMLKQQMQGILLQFTDISKVFNAASLQKVWDHFTKAQRKNIELWKKQTEEIKNAHVEEVLNDRIEDEMDVSDDEGDNSRKNGPEALTVTDEFGNKVDALEEVNKLREENDALRCQLEASQNETALHKSETEQEKDLRERHVQAMKQALQNMQKELISLNQKQKKDEAELKELRNYKLKRKECSDKDLVESSHDRDDEKKNKRDFSSSSDTDLQRDSLGFLTGVSSSMNSSLYTVTEIEARWIGLVSTFLNVHPFGASIDYICSYLHQIDCTIRARDVEALMKKFPTVFKEESTGIGASLEKKWTFCGFKSHV